MRALIQRVLSASVHIEGREHALMNKGLLIFLGVGEHDTEQDLLWLAGKIASIRLFQDSEGRMNLSTNQAGASMMVISQFTLYASTSKGNRPGFTRAAQPEKAIPLYESFCIKLEELSETKVERGIFGADMKVSLLNDGPVTIWMDTQNKE